MEDRHQNLGQSSFPPEASGSREGGLIGIIDFSSLENISSRLRRKGNGRDWKKDYHFNYDYITTPSGEAVHPSLKKGGEF